MFTLKNGSVEEPSLYLGTDIKKWRLDAADELKLTRWAMSSDSYCRKAIAEVKRELHAAGLKHPTCIKTPLSSGYQPELDGTAELGPDKQQYYQGLIGMLHWLCELGRIDIMTPVLMISRYLLQAWRGHLEQLFHVFAYLKEHGCSTMVFDDTISDLNDGAFVKCNWVEFYPDAKEAILHNAPKPLGKSVVVLCFVNADHAECRVTQRSHTGVVIFVNRALIMFYSKWQNTVESLTFGLKFVAIKTAVEMIEGLRYKLRVMGVPLKGEANVFYDNNAIVKSASNPEATLKKHHNSIIFHRCREAIASQTIWVAKEDGRTNLADVLTKLLLGPTLKELVLRILW